MRPKCDFWLFRVPICLVISVLISAFCAVSFCGSVGNFRCQLENLPDERTKIALPRAEPPADFSHGGNRKPKSAGPIFDEQNVAAQKQNLLSQRNKRGTDQVSHILESSVALKKAKLVSSCPPPATGGGNLNQQNALRNDIGVRRGQGSQCAIAGHCTCTLKDTSLSCVENEEESSKKEYLNVEVAAEIIDLSRFDRLPDETVLQILSYVLFDKNKLDQLPFTRSILCRKSSRFSTLVDALLKQSAKPWMCALYVALKSSMSRAVLATSAYDAVCCCCIDIVRKIESCVPKIFKPNQSGGPDARAVKLSRVPLASFFAAHLYNGPRVRSYQHNTTAMLEDQIYENIKAWYYGRTEDMNRLDALVDFLLPLLDMAAKECVLLLVESCSWPNAIVKEQVLDSLLAPANVACLHKLRRALHAFLLVEIWLQNASHCAVEGNCFIGAFEWFANYKRFWYQKTYKQAVFDHRDFDLYLSSESLIPCVIGSAESDGAFLNGFFLPLLALTKHGMRLTVTEATTFIRSYGRNFFYETISQELIPESYAQYVPVKTFTELWNDLVQTVSTNLGSDIEMNDKGPPCAHPQAARFELPSAQPSVFVRLDQAAEIARPGGLVVALGLVRNYYRILHGSCRTLVHLELLKDLIRKRAVNWDPDLVQFVLYTVEHIYMDAGSWKDFFDNLEKMVMIMLLAESRTCSVPNGVIFIA